MWVQYHTTTRCSSDMSSYHMMTRMSMYKYACRIHSSQFGFFFCSQLPPYVTVHLFCVTYSLSHVKTEIQASCSLDLVHNRHIPVLQQGVDFVQDVTKYIGQHTQHQTQLKVQAPIWSTPCTLQGIPQAKEYVVMICWTLVA